MGYLQYFNVRRQKIYLTLKSIKMEDLKEKLINDLINQIRLDIYDGDTTVLAEILGNVPNDVLIESLPEENWSEFEPLL